jgi:hypothetical protein
MPFKQEKVIDSKKKAIKNFSLGSNKDDFFSMFKGVKIDDIPMFESITRRQWVRFRFNHDQLRFRQKKLKIMEMVLGFQNNPRLYCMV